ncbi:DNA-primase RepB domain-containing protein, partial [Mannheimia haemolytica]
THILNGKLSLFRVNCQIKSDLLHLNTVLNTLQCDYVLFSSEDNYQVIINLKKADYPKNEANFITMTLNKKFGDAKFSGANHYLRCASFFNKKSTNNNEKSVLVDFTNTKTEEDNKCYFDNLLSSYKNNNVKLEPLDIKIIDELGDDKAVIAQKEIQAEIALCKRIFKQLDWSAVDFRIVKRLYRKGFSENEIAVALVRFTDFEDRHCDSHDYLTRTITKAIQNYQQCSKAC